MSGSEMMVVLSPIVMARMMPTASIGLSLCHRVPAVCMADETVGILLVSVGVLVADAPEVSGNSPYVFAG